MDINAAVGGKAGLARAKIEAALGMNESNDLEDPSEWSVCVSVLGPSSAA
jgi:hypothetical protein